MEWIKWAKTEATHFCKDLRQELNDIDTVLSDMLYFDKIQPTNGNNLVFDKEYVLADRKSDDQFIECSQFGVKAEYAMQRQLILERDERVRRVYAETVGEGLVNESCFWAQWRLFHRSRDTTTTKTTPRNDQPIAIDDWE